MWDVEGAVPYRCVRYGFMWDVEGAVPYRCVRMVLCGMSRAPSPTAVCVWFYVGRRGRRPLPLKLSRFALESVYYIFEHVSALLKILEHVKACGGRR